jgi:hypothetical protein
VIGAVSQPRFGGKAAKVLRRLKAQHPQCSVTLNGRHHWQFSFPNGRSVIVPSTFFDGPMVKALAAQLRRAARAAQ